MSQERRFFIFRHSSKPNEDSPESKEYKGLSEKGLKEIKEEKIPEIKEFIEKAPERSLVCLVGSSDEERTKSSLELYGEGLKEVFDGKDDILILGRGEIDALGDSMEERKKHILALLNNGSNLNRKVVIDLPLLLKQFSFTKNWGISDEPETNYFRQLKKKNGGDEEKVFLEWIKTKGETEGGGLKGPDPEQIAQGYLLGIDRLEEAISQEIPNRPLVIGAVGHRLDLDATILKLITGEITPEAFEAVSNNRATDVNEGVSVVIKGSNMDIKFRGNEYNVFVEKINANEAY